MRPAGISKCQDLMIYISQSTDFGLWPEFSLLAVPRPLISNGESLQLENTEYLRPKE